MRVGEVLNNVDGTTIFGLNTRTYRTYPFKFYLYFGYVRNWAYIFFHCNVCYLYSPHFIVVLKSLYYILAFDANFHMTVSVLFSWPM